LFGFNKSYTRSYILTPKIIKWQYMMYTMYATFCYSIKTNFKILFFIKFSRPFINKWIYIPWFFEGIVDKIPFKYKICLKYLKFPPKKAMVWTKFPHHFILKNLVIYFELSNLQLICYFKEMIKIFKQIETMP